jgi:DNA adenine methylase
LIIKRQDIVSEPDMGLEKILEQRSEIDTKNSVFEAEASASPKGVATPFVKWVGGKRSIMDALKARLPEDFNHYYEPFIGGGALFFELHRKLQGKAYLSDTNFDLVTAYSVVQRAPDQLLKLLREHARKHGEEYYYKMRDKHHLQNPAEIAARLLYLNKTCYNGLWRVNSKGEFNVPIGRYKNPGIVQEENILACCQALQGVDVRLASFDEIKPVEGDFVYFDPPYHPMDDTSFTRYAKLGFNEQDQVRLRDFSLKLHKQGVNVMLSNSDTPFIRNLYGSKVFQIATVQALRLVNCKANKRNAVNEVLITNY